MLKVIITDVDQVLLDYISGIREYVNARDGKSITGHPLTWNMTSWLQLSSNEETFSTIAEFSSTDAFGDLDPFPGAGRVLNSLRDDMGIGILCLTACGSAPITEVARKLNLKHCFGDIFDEIHFVEYTDSKVDKLNDIASRYDVVAFIDDKPENIMEAATECSGIGKVILMKAPHNREFREQKRLCIDYAFSWYECKQYIKDYLEER